MEQYRKLLSKIITQGEVKGDRTGTGTLSVFGHQMRFDLADGLPLLTAKFVPWKSVLAELLWFIRGDNNIKWLQEQGCTIWDEWADSQGSVGPMYGCQWRNWPCKDTLGVPTYVDQLRQVIEQLRQRPDSRRHLVSAWNVEYLPDEAESPQQNVQDGRMALAPCHAFFQFYVSADRKLSCQVYQRSADVFLGLPFNLASYATLTMMIAKLLGYGPGELIWTGGDCHLYSNHLEQSQELLRRYAAGEVPDSLPQLEIRGQQRTIDDFTMADFTLHNYTPLGKLPGKVAV